MHVMHIHTYIHEYIYKHTLTCTHTYTHNTHIHTHIHNTYTYIYMRIETVRDGRESVQTSRWYLYTGSLDTTVRRWDVQTGTCIQVFDLEYGDVVPRFKAGIVQVCMYVLHGHVCMCACVRDLCVTDMCMSDFIHVHTHTYIHTLIHTHTYTHIHAYMHTYVRTYIHTYRSL
jgi:hypothetical protein